MGSHFNKEQVELYRILFGKRVSDAPTDQYASEKSKLSLALMRKDQQGALPYVTSGYTFDALIQSISCGETLFRLLLRQYKQDGSTPERDALLLIEAINQNNLVVFELILTFAELTDHVVDYGLRVGELPIFLAIEERSYIPGRTFDGGFNALEILIGRPLNYLEKIEAVISECISMGQGVGSYASCPNTVAVMERLFKRCGASDDLLTNLALACARDRAVTTHVKAIQNKDPTVFDRTYSSQVAVLMAKHGVRPRKPQIKVCCRSLETAIRRHHDDRDLATDALYWMGLSIKEYGVKSFFNPLNVAIRHNHYAFVARWLDQGCPLQIGRDDHALFVASKSVNFRALELIVDHSEDVNIQDMRGDTPLHHVMADAISTCVLDGVEILVNAGANPMAVNDDGISPESISFKCSNPDTKAAIQVVLASRQKSTLKDQLADILKNKNDDPPPKRKGGL